MLRVCAYSGLLLPAFGFSLGFGELLGARQFTVLKLRNIILAAAASAVGSLESKTSWPKVVFEVTLPTIWKDGKGKVGRIRENKTRRIKDKKEAEEGR